MSTHTKDEFKMFTYLGQKIKDNALKDSACMEESLRNMVGYIQAYSVFSGDVSFLDLIEPLRIMARYGWHRMEVTDLSLMLGESITHVSYKQNEPENPSVNEEDIDADL